MTVASNQITLPAGTYDFDISVPAYRLDQTQTRLYNVTDGTVALHGMNGYARDDYAGHTFSAIKGRVTIGATKTFAVQLRAQGSRATNGLGVMSGFGTETYTFVGIRKINSGGGGGGGASQLSDLTDVNTSGATAGSVIRYDGANWVVSTSGDSSALGDRITSGTVSVTVNTNGFISLTTGVTDWGYLSSGNSYLPALVATRVSSTNISATHLQLSSPSTVLACGAGLEGAMRYTSGTMQVCDGSNWGNIGIGVPTGTIAAFAASSCPNGWSEYTASRGRFLRGIDNGAGNDPNGTRSPGNTQDDAMQDHNHNLGSTADRYASGTGRSDIGYNNGQSWNGSYESSGPQTFGVGGTPRVSSETRPKNVAVTFCVYSGFQSAGVNTNAEFSGTFSSEGLTDVPTTGGQDGVLLNANGYISAYRSTGNAVGYFGRPNDGAVINFYRGAATTVGSISVAAGATAYNTSSDYRLKDHVRPLDHALDRVGMLQPASFNFKTDPDVRMDGFIAHEVQKVAPYAVTGEKDGKDKDGKPVYQQIDYGKLTPLLTAAIQELKRMLDTVIADFKNLAAKVLGIQEELKQVKTEIEDELKQVRAENADLRRALDELTREVKMMREVSMPFKAANDNTQADVKDRLQEKSSVKQSTAR